ncbi:MAG: T9SS type A sorting domain-containing protein [Crocinitomicaceae bacterium]|nr:T9SS type A sorting domain-containing protein [Crocinitomicaceae bacterium]
MKKKWILSIAVLTISNLLMSQWEQSTGTENLNFQALISVDNHDFAGGATGSYLSTDESASYLFSNSGNDDFGPTRGYTSDDDYIYTCTSQGVFRSDNLGSTWSSKSNGLPSLLCHGMISVGSYLFVGTPNGVFKTIDQGENWSSAGMDGEDSRCITNIADTLFVGTNGNGIFKSIDFGDSWVSVNNGLSSTNFRAIESKGNTLFAGGQIGTGVFRSIDFGNSWELLGGGLATGSYRGFASNDQLILAGSFGSGVFYSTDNGDNWTSINIGLLDQTIFDLEINENYIIAATNAQGVFRFSLSELNLGLSSENASLSISVYPNPVANILTIENINPSIQAYTIVDISGNIIQAGFIEKSKQIIDVSHLPGAAYCIKINDHTFRFIKTE